MVETMVQEFVMLPVIRKLFDSLHEHQINYCHWKNNPDHIRASFTGESDVDVLFDITEKNKVEAVLQELGFKKFNVVPERDCADIEDYLRIDFTTGKLIHLHTHYRLTMGPLFSKNYQLGIEPLVLQKRVYHESTQLFASTPEIQLLILYLNESLKFRIRDKLNIYLRNKTKYADKVKREYNWLHERVSVDALITLTAQIFDSQQEKVLQILQAPFDKKQMLKFGALVRKQFHSKQIYSSGQAYFTRWYNETVINIRKVLKKFMEPVLSRRLNPRGGFVVAVVGADGSGKSTVTKDLRATFEKKLDVSRIYFGRGDGRISFSRKVLRKIKDVLLPEKKSKKKKTGSSDEKVKAYQEKKKGFAATFYKVLEAVLVANEKRVNLKRMIAARKLGMLVICDRFPQNQIAGYNDGPLLQHLLDSNNPFFKWIAQWEGSVYASAEATPPDLLIKLIAEASIVEQRKPGETEIEKLEAKIEGIKALKMRDNCTVLTIDAAQPLQQVLYQVRETIWNKL